MKVLHFIDQLNYGGAETMLMAYIPMLPEYEHIVVTLDSPNVYNRQGYEYIELHLQPPRKFFQAVIALRKIIREKGVDIVHAHSFWTNIISRLATPGKVQLFNHYHFADYDTMKHLPGVRRMLLIDRAVKRKSLTRLAVSDYVRQILQKNFSNARTQTIPNFINLPIAPPRVKKEGDTGLRIIAIGNCNREKNYDVLLQAFALLKTEPVSIDIIGGGDLLPYYREECNRMGLHQVQFLGFMDRVRDRLPDYDLFLSTSISETFGIAVLEAVSAGLPLILSDIPAYREIAPAGTPFFSPHNGEELAMMIREFLVQRREVDEAAYASTLEKYAAPVFLEHLKKIYNNKICVV